MAVDLVAVNNEGDAPESRLKDYESATRLYTVLREADLIPSRNRELVHRLQSGEPPRDQSRMDEEGYGDLSNVNSLRALADRDQAVTTFVGLADATPTLITVKTRGGDVGKQPDYEKAIAEEYTWLMRNGWSSFRNREQTKAVALVSDGLGLEYWPDPVDWRSEVGRPGQFLFPPDASTDIAKWEVVLQVEQVQASKLYELIKKFDALEEADKENSGIDRESVLKAVQDACKANQDTVIGRDVLERFKDNDLCATYAQSQKIKLVHYYIREYSGKVSHYVGRADGLGPNFLEVHKEAFEGMDQCFALYADGVGEGEISSLQGIIWRAYPDYLQRDLLRCAMYDAGMIACKQLIKTGQGAQANEKAAQVNFGGPMVFLPPGVEPTDNQFSAAPIGALMELINESSTNIANNTGGYASHDFSPEGLGRTATEASLQASNNAQIGGAKMVNFCHSSEASHNIRYNRLKRKDYFSWQPGWKERQEWINRLTARGVPMEAIYGVYEVKYVRPIGLGSPVQQQAAFSFLRSVRPFMDPVGQRNLDRDMAAATGTDYGTLDRYLPVLDTKRATPDEIIAPIENSAFASGTPLPVFENQDPYIHIPAHLPFFDNTQQLLQQGVIDLRQAIRETGPALQHVQLHLKAATDPGRADEVKGWQQAFDAAAKTFGQMQQDFQSQQAQPPQGQAPVDPKDAIGDLNAMANLVKAGVPITHDQISAALQKAGLPPFPPDTGLAQTPQGPVSQPVAPLANPATAKLQEIQGNLQIQAARSQGEQAILNQEAQARIDRANQEAAAKKALDDLKTADQILPNAPTQPTNQP